MDYLENKYDPTHVQSLLNKASFLDPRFCDMYLDGGVKDGVKPMIPEEGELLLTSVNMSESVSEESTASKPPPPKK